MKSTILIQLFALPATLAANLLELDIVASVSTSAIVLVKSGPDGKARRMNTSEYGDEQRCLGDDGVWDIYCKDRIPYRKIGFFAFAEKTKEPSTFRISTAESERSVS